MWLAWLKIACAVTVCVGLIASAASTTVGAAPWLFLFDLLKWPLDGDPVAFAGETFAVNAVLGGVMVGWGTLMYLLAAGPIARGDRAIVGPS